MSYLEHILIIWALLAALAVSLDLVVGQLGILSLCHGAFYGLGAYSAAWLMMTQGMPFPLACLCGMLVAAAAAQPVAWVARRLRHDSLVLATLAVLLITLELFRNLRSLTGGLDGISGIPSPRWPGFAAGAETPWVFLAVAVLLLTVGVVRHIGGSPLGRWLRAYRDDPALAVSLGVDPSRAVASAMAISSGLAGLVGGVYASYAQYINPAVFGFDQSVLLLAMVILGGAGTAAGPVVGAMVLVAVPEVLRMVGVGSASVGAFQQTLFGTALLLLVIWRPQGILRGYRFE